MDPTALGRYLRESRESRERSLEDAVRALRIRRPILEAFENGDFDVADSPVRVRGMLRNYARYLGLDEERVLEYYEASRAGKRRRRFAWSRSEPEPELTAPRRVTDTPPSLPAVPQTIQRNWDIAPLLRNIALVLVSLASIAVIAFVIYDTLGIGQNEEAPPVAVASTLDPAGQAATLTNTPTITPRPTQTSDSAMLGISGVQLELELTQRSWVRVVVDEGEVFSGILEPGTLRQYQGSSQITLTAANAAALVLNFNGVSQPATGARGQQVEWVFSTTGVDVALGPDGVPPSATPAPATDTPPPSPSPTATVEMLAAPDTPTAPFTLANATPTPLFGALDQDTTSATDAQAADTVGQATTPVSAQVIVTASPSEASTSAVSVTPAPTATSAAVLPPRTTPDNPTPTKQG